MELEMEGPPPQKKYKMCPSTNESVIRFETQNSQVELTQRTPDPNLQFSDDEEFEHLLLSQDNIGEIDRKVAEVLSVTEEKPPAPYTPGYFLDTVTVAPKQQSPQSQSQVPGERFDPTKTKLWRSRKQPEITPVQGYANTRINYENKYKDADAALKKRDGELLVLRYQLNQARKDNSMSQFKMLKLQAATDEKLQYLQNEIEQIEKSHKDQIHFLEQEKQIILSRQSRLPNGIPFSSEAPATSQRLRKPFGPSTKDFMFQVSTGPRQKSASMSQTVPHHLLGPPVILTPPKPRTRDQATATVLQPEKYKEYPIKVYFSRELERTAIALERCEVSKPRMWEQIKAEINKRCLTEAKYDHFVAPKKKRRKKGDPVPKGPLLTLKPGFVV